MDLLTDKMINKLKDGNHSVGAHSMTHQAIRLYDNQLFVQENKEAFSMLREKGFNSDLVRAPYGSTYLTDKQIGDIRDQKWILLDWDIDSLDWEFRDANQTYNHIIEQLNKIEEGNSETIVILLHERPETVDILNKLIPELQNRNYLLTSGEEVPFEELIF
ncbi:hypothetical protein CV093_04725 [Oceanobacillus sp. 143]|nr:hypothetical protein CV093_04725 [Oceanobacillus sp. 143]